MSRGGRGGFGGRGGGRAGAGSNMPPMGLSFQELGSLDKAPSKLYPEAPTVPRMERPDDKEIRYASYQLMYLQEQKTSAYWPTLEQRKQGDLTRFSDRYRPEAQDLPSLKSINLQKEVFPKGLWDSFMEGETKREEEKGEYPSPTTVVGAVVVRFVSEASHTDTGLILPASAPQPRRRHAARSIGTRSTSKIAQVQTTTWQKHRPNQTIKATTKMKSTTTTPKTTLTTAKTMMLATTTAVSLPMTSLVLTIASLSSCCPFAYPQHLYLYLTFSSNHNPALHIRFKSVILCWHATSTLNFCTGDQIQRKDYGC